MWQPAVEELSLDNQQTCSIILLFGLHETGSKESDNLKQSSGLTFTEHKCTKWQH